MSTHCTTRYWPIQSCMLITSSHCWCRGICPGRARVIDSNKSSFRSSRRCCRLLQGGNQIEERATLIRTNVPSSVNTSIALITTRGKKGGQKRRKEQRKKQQLLQTPAIAEDPSERKLERTGQSQIAARARVSVNGRGFLILPCPATYTRLKAFYVRK